MKDPTHETNWDMLGYLEYIEPDADLPRTVEAVSKERVAKDEDTHKARKSLPVPGGRVHHVRVQEARDDTRDVVQVSCKSNSLGTEAGGRHFTDDAIGKGLESALDSSIETHSNSKVVGKHPEQDHGRLTPFRSLRTGP